MEDLTCRGESRFLICVLGTTNNAFEVLSSKSLEGFSNARFKINIKKYIAILHILQNWFFFFFESHYWRCLEIFSVHLWTFQLMIQGSQASMKSFCSMLPKSTFWAIKVFSVLLYGFLYTRCAFACKHHQSINSAKNDKF